jgi:hypothetical protein
MVIMESPHWFLRDDASEQEEAQAAIGIRHHADPSQEWWLVGMPHVSSSNRLLSVEYTRNRRRMDAIEGRDSIKVLLDTLRTEHFAIGAVETVELVVAARTDSAMLELVRHSDGHRVRIPNPSVARDSLLTRYRINLLNGGGAEWRLELSQPAGYHWSEALVVGDVIGSEASVSLGRTNTASGVVDLGDHRDNSRSGATGLQVAPNPATDEVWVGVPDGYGQEWTLRVCDVTGREVISARGILKSTTLDVSSLPSGVYVIRAEQPGRLITHQISVIR